MDEEALRFGGRHAQGVGGQAGPLESVVSGEIIGQPAAVSLRKQIGQGDGPVARIDEVIARVRDLHQLAAQSDVLEVARGAVGYLHVG